MPDLYTLTAVWRKPSSELTTSTPGLDPRTLEEYVDALAKVASDWNLPPFAPPPLPHPCNGGSLRTVCTLAPRT